MGAAIPFRPASGSEAILSRGIRGLPHAVVASSNGYPGGDELEIAAVVRNDAHALLTIPAPENGIAAPALGITENSARYWCRGVLEWPPRNPSSLMAPRRRCRPEWRSRPMPVSWAGKCFVWDDAPPESVSIRGRFIFRTGSSAAVSQFGWNAACLRVARPRVADGLQEAAPGRGGRCMV